MEKHPGFKAVAASIAAKGGFSKERAAAILASRTRAASPAAKKKNPNLERVLIGHHTSGRFKKRAH